MTIPPPPADRSPTPPLDMPEAAASFGGSAAPVDAERRGRRGRFRRAGRTGRFRRAGAPARATRSARAPSRPPAHDATGAAYRYDAFISYSHAADGRLAPALQRTLQTLAKPWYQRRALRIFRDQTSLSASPELWPLIERALEESEHLLLLTSPEAAASPWVDDEVAWWRAHRDPRRCLIGITDGGLAWDKATGDFTLDSDIPPNARGWFDSEPLWVDLRWARREHDVSARTPKFRDAVADFAAPLRGLRKDELVGEDIRLHRRALKLAWGAVTLLLLLAAAATVAAVVAMVQRDTAQSRELAAAATSQLASDPALSVLLAVEAAEIKPTAQATTALRRALGASRETAVLSMPSAPTESEPSVTPDGRFAVQAGEDRRARVWDLRAERLVATLSGHRDPGGIPEYADPSLHLVAAMHPGGRHVAVGGDDGGLEVRDWRSGRVVQALARPPGGEVGPLAFDPHGDVLAVGTRNGSLNGNGLDLWDWRRGTLVRRLRGVDGDVEGVDFDGAGALAIAASLEGGVGIWDVRTGERLGRLDVGGNGNLTDAALSRDGRLAATATGGGVVEVWNWRRERAVSRLQAGGSSRVAFTSDPRMLVTTGAEGDVRVWDWADRRALAVLSGHRGAVTGAAVARDRTVVTTGFDRTLRRWSPGLASTGIPAVEGELIDRVAFAPDGERIVTTGIGPNGRFAAVFDLGSRRRIARVTDSANFGGDHGAWLRIAFSRDGRFLAGAGDSGFARVWDPETGDRLVALPHRRAGWVGDADFSPDGRLLATTGGDRRVWIWDWRARRVVGRLRSPGGAPGVGYFPGPIAFHRDGAHIAAADGDNATIWNWRTRRVEASLPVSFGLRDLEFDPSGTRLGVAGGDGARVWDWERDRVVAELHGSGAVASVDFSPDGELVLTAEPAGAASVWHWSTEQLVAQWRSMAPTAATFDAGVLDARFSPDGRRFVIAGRDSRAHVYRCDVCGPLPALVALARSRSPRGLTAVERRRYLHEDG